MVFESMIDRNTCHADIDTWLERIALWIESQNGRMLCDIITEKNHIYVVVKVFFFLTRWFLAFQLTGYLKREDIRSRGLPAQRLIAAGG